MANAQELHKYCEQLREVYDKELENVFNEYFEIRFIKRHKPFRAIIGNKRCKPIPIYKDIDDRTGLFYWPNFSEELLRKKLKT